VQRIDCHRIVLSALLVLLCSAAIAADAPRIDQARGADPRVDYAALQSYGPWDDRNYQLKREDLRLLAANEAELADPIPAFFRVELRREFPDLPRSGPVQYPRASVPLFHLRYGGLMRDGRIERLEGEEGEGDEEGSRVPVPVNSEVQLNTLQGANEITIELNPTNGQRVIAGANVNTGQEMYYSANGGESWTIQGVLPNTCCDPTVAWSSDGSVAYAGALSGSLGVSFWRSFDNGQTWVNRVAIQNNGSDKEFLHVDISPTSPFRDNLYMTYHKSNVMQVSRSVNQGETWTTTAFPSAPRGIGSDITSDSDGNVYHFYGAFNERRIVLLKSTDGGASWQPPFTVANTQASFDWPIPAFETRRAWIYASADTDRSGGPFDGSVYVAWTDTTAPDVNNAAANHTQIHVAFSRNGGASWQQSFPHETDDVLTVDRFNQWLAVDQSGVVHVAYYDTRNSADRKSVDLYYSFSADGGVTWNEPQRISSETSANLTDGQEWGDYNGISVLDQKIVTTWTDNRNGPPNRKNVIAAEMTNVAADADGDGLSDSADNCIEAANANQRDTDGDGIGNICDPDLNDDCIVNTLDLGRLKSVFFTGDADADFNGDGSVNFSDLGILQGLFFQPPGPSGVPNDCAAN
jgi:hypothetical protein